MTRRLFDWFFKHRMLLFHSGRYLVGPQHLGLFMFEHVAMPNVAFGESLELHDDACYGHGIDAKGVSPARLLEAMLEGP